MSGKEPLWAGGPGEILRHGISLLTEDSDTNRRLAMISIDNSVELMMQTFIQLPKRVTGLDLTRRERDEVCKNFPSLLDGIETHAAELVVGFDLGDIEWFHRLRNQLYHDGNGLTVERQKVELYAELAQRLFEALYGVKLDVPDTDNMRRFGEFMEAWDEIEKATSKQSNNRRGFMTESSLRELRENGKLSEENLLEIRELRKLRNELVHGMREPKETLSSQVLERAKKLSQLVVEALI